MTTINYLQSHNKGIQCCFQLKGDASRHLQAEVCISLTGQHADADWAKKADWSAGGTVARPAGKQPKPPITAQQAYTQYLIAQAERDFHEAAPDSAEHQHSLTMLKVEDSCMTPCPYRVAS